MINIKRYAKEIHDGLGALLAYIAPLLAPLPSAIAIWSATGNLIIAIVVESLGFSATAVALRTYRHNKQRPGQRFPLWLPVAMFGVYFATTMLIIIAAETLPTWAAWQAQELPAWEFIGSIAPALYPLLTMVGAGVYALVDNLDHLAIEHDQEHAIEHAQQELELERQRREMEIELEQKTLDAEAKREASRLKLEAKLSQTSPSATKKPVLTTGETASDSDVLSQLETFVRQNPFASLRQIEDATGIGKDTAGRRLKAGGWHKNGNGWESLS